MTKHELKKLMDEMAAMPSTERMVETGNAMSAYLIAHPQETAEVMEWFNMAQQKMQETISNTSVINENEEMPEENFSYMFTPQPDAEKCADHIEWTYNRICAEIEALKANGTKLKGLLIHCDGEPDFFDIQGWEMANGEYGDELFMHCFGEEDDLDEDLDEENEEDIDEEGIDEEEDFDEENFDPEAYYANLMPIHQAKPDIIGAAISRIHSEGKWAEVIAHYPFTFYIEIHDDGADTEFLIINNAQGATPSPTELNETLKRNKKRKTAEDFYNEILRGNE